MSTTAKVQAQDAYLEQLHRWAKAARKGSRTPALKSVITRAFAAFAIQGAINALDAPGNPFTVEPK
jgi:hypothetical protein